MRLRKTRTTYTYHFENGDKVILEPGNQQLFMLRAVERYESMNLLLK